MIDDSSPVKKKNKNVGVTAHNIFQSPHAQDARTLAQAAQFAS